MFIQQSNNKVFNFSSLHEHGLVLVNKHSSSWRCNAMCRERKGDKAYYCYECDYDCCVPCFEFSKMAARINVTDHEHVLKPAYRRVSWACNKCNFNGTSYHSRYRCHECDYDLCWKCRFPRD